MRTRPVNWASGAAVPAIELVGAERRYGERDALYGIDFSVPEGATLAVLGSNGAGKTTLLKLLCGLLRPHAGKVSVLGHDLPRETWAIRGAVGLLCHEPLLYDAMSVRENLHHQARLNGKPTNLADRLIDQVGLAKRADEPVRNLSRGTVQRASAARALICEPKLLLLDEPWANLDPAGAALIEPLLTGNFTRVITGHDPKSLIAQADLALGLKSARSVFFTDASSVTDVMIEELYR